jgi:protein SCO1/2
MIPMNRVRRWVLLAVLGAVAVVSACGADEAAVDSGGGGGSGLRGIVRPEPLQVGDVTLPDVTEDPAGVPFTFRARPGELLIAYFGYTGCPDVCPTTLADLKVARSQLDPAEAARIDLAMVTVDPERDTPERLGPYLRSFAERYHAVRTTDFAALAAAEAAFAASSTRTTTPEGRVEVGHTGTTYVVDEHGQVLVEWSFGTPPEDMANDLRVLLARQAA